MRSSKWSAHGNIYLLVEDERLTPERARELSAQHKTDGVLEVVTVEGVKAEIAIWNPAGSRAEIGGARRGGDELVGHGRGGGRGGTARRRRDRGELPGRRPPRQDRGRAGLCARPRRAARLTTA